MRYDYFCNRCSNNEQQLCFETTHGMNEKPKVKCPKCGETDTEVAFLTVPISYIRGYGWLDVRGRRRDMNLHKLVNDDPYANMRQPGEADDLATKLRRGGRASGNRKTFAVKKSKK